MIVIIDSGASNAGSVLNALTLLKQKAVVSHQPAEIRAAKGLILPGVGAFDQAMNKLEPLRGVLEEKVLEQKCPLLGICLGMQVLAEHSEEGFRPGLGWVKGSVKKLPAISAQGETAKSKVPHMGWNTVRPHHSDGLFRRTASASPSDWFFYFVHSYYLEPTSQKDVMGTTDNGFSFTSALQSGNIYGVQFHPEKSHAAGLQLLQNFLEVVK